MALFDFPPSHLKSQHPARAGNSQRIAMMKVFADYFPFVTERLPVLPPSSFPLSLKPPRCSRCEALRRSYLAFVALSCCPLSAEVEGTKRISDYRCEPYLTGVCSLHPLLPPPPPPPLTPTHRPVIFAFFPCQTFV